MRAHESSQNTLLTGDQHHGSSQSSLLCREGVVVTLVEKSEQFVIEKLSRGLGVSIPELQMREGMIAPVGSHDWEAQATSKEIEQQ